MTSLKRTSTTHNLRIDDIGTSASELVPTSSSSSSSDILVTPSGKKFIQSLPTSRPHNRRATDTGTSRAWIGTFFHDESTTSDGSYDLSLPFPHLDHDAITSLVGQWEESKSGKLHFHYFVSFPQPVRVTAVRKALDCFRGYLEVARSQDASLIYVTDERKRIGQLIEIGNEPPGSGHSIGKIEAFNAALSGASLTSIMNKFPDQFARYHASLSKVCANKDTPRFLPTMPEVYIYYGPTGTGKSFKAYSENPDAYRKILAGKWWDGYDDHKTVIFEEFDPNAKNEQQLPEFLKVCDKYPYRIEVKGGSMQLKANKFIFTTNIHPGDWWAGNPQAAAFRRRVTKVLVFTTPGDSSAFEEYTFGR